MSLPLYLADKSAIEHGRRNDGARALLGALTGEGAIASSHVVALEVLYSARNRDEYRSLRAGVESLPWLPVDTAVMDRAMEVQGLLAERGQHRLPLADLVVAAAAERHAATVLHYDNDFDLIAAITGQATRWVVPRPS